MCDFYVCADGEVVNAFGCNPDMPGFESLSALEQFEGGVYMVQGHCMKCKGKQDMKDAKISQTARGGYMCKGTCTSCGTKMAAIMSKDNAEKAMADGEAEKA